MPFNARAYVLERLENLLVYERTREELIKNYFGQWVAIARGRLIARSDTAAACITAANREAPGITHRFVFCVGAPLPETKIFQDIPQIRVNECKDIQQCVDNLVNQDALGIEIDKAGGTLTDDYKNRRTCITLNGKTKCWKWQGQDIKIGGISVHQWINCIEIVVDQIGTDEKRKKCALLDSGCSGSTLVLDPANFLDLVSTAEFPDDSGKADTAGGGINVKHGLASLEIPQVDFSLGQVVVATHKDRLKEEVERRYRKQGEEDVPPLPPGAA